MVSNTIGGLFFYHCVSSGYPRGTGGPLELFPTVQHWFERTRSVLLGYLRTMPQDYLSGPEMRKGLLRAVKTVSTKFNGDRGGHIMKYGMASQVYNRIVQQLGGEKAKTDVFASRDAPQLRKCTRHWHKGDSAWCKHWGLKEWGPMYWHGAQEDTRRTVNKIDADGAMGILVVTDLGSSPCPLEDLKPTLDSITLNEMQFGPEEQLFIGAKGIPMPAKGQAWSTKAFLVDGSQFQPTGDEAFIRRVEAVRMRVMFEEKSDPTESVDVLSHSEGVHLSAPGI